MDATMTAPKSKRKDRTVKIDDAIAVKVDTMCAYRKIPMSEYLSDKLRDAVDRDFAEFKRQLASEDKPHKR